MYHRKRDNLMLLKLLIGIILGILFYRLVKSLFLPRSPASDVKGQAPAQNNIQEKYKHKIEDADFEEIE